jgi:hypothetical protein
MHVYMSSISSVAPGVASGGISSVESSIDQQTLAALQIQLSAYFQAADSQNPQVKAAYQALQSAVNLGDVSQAQAALATLQRVNQSANPNPAASASRPPVDNNGDQGGRDLNVKA